MSYSYFAQVYDLLTENVEYSERADYICSLLSENGIDGGLLLDLACGTGSMSVELAKRGFEVTGVDLSEEMLAQAQNKMYASGESILFLCQDMCKLDLYGTIDCAVCTLDSLNHLKDENDVKKAFQNVALFLEDNGVFIFDMNTLYKHRKILADNTYIYEYDDLFCVWQNSLCEDNATINIDLDFFEKIGENTYERFSESFQEKAYSDETIEKLLNETGFELVNRYEEMTRNKPTETTQRTVYVARRLPR